MRILHVISNLSPRYGGPSKVCIEMSRALARVGEEVTIYTTNRDFPAGVMKVPHSVPVNKSGYTVWYFPVEFPPYAMSLGMARRLRGNLQDFDVIHIHGLYRFPQAAAAHYARLHRVPYIIRPHGSLDPFLYHRRKNRLVKRAYEHLVERRNLDQAAAIHFTSQEEMDLTSLLNLRAMGVVIPNGLDLAEYRDLPDRGRFRERYGLGDKKIILHLGRINFKKGLDILVGAFARLAKSREDVRLVLAGPDNEGFGAQVKEWLTERGVEDKAVFTGMLQGEEKLEVLVDADVFALPSYTENFGIAVVEAMASGLPVVISDRVNIWREVAEAGAGLITTCNERDVAEATSALLEDCYTRQVMGEAGKALVRRSYDWDSLVWRLIDVYRGVSTKA